jgi:hypothetical protein
MSTPEHDGQVEARSSIKATRNAKGDAQFEVNVVAGETDDVLNSMLSQAVHQYQELARELGGVG